MALTPCFVSLLPDYLLMWVVLKKIDGVLINDGDYSVNCLNFVT